MNDKQLAYYKSLLQNWKEQLLQGAENTISHMREDSIEPVADILDRATLEEEFTLELRTRDRERKLLDKINQSIRLIDLKEYGFCQVCDAEISLDRLNARPTATLCIDCKSVAEKKHA